MITADKMLSWSSDSAQRMTVINQLNRRFTLKRLLKVACLNVSKGGKSSEFLSAEETKRKSD